MQSKPMSEREKEYQTLMKDWLSFLPEIMQEIQSFLALPQNAELPPGVHHAELSPFLESITDRMHFSRLQNCLSRLDKFPDVQEILNETDTSILSSIFSEFELVKRNARAAILTIRTSMEQEPEDHGGNTHSWAVNIDPSFYVPARLLVSCQEDCYQIVFSISLSEKSISTSLIQMNLPRNWVDPIEKPLRQLNLFQKRKQLFLDGIGYELSCFSETSRSMIEFSNPSTSPLIEIERGFFSVAEMVVNEKGQQAEKSYLTEWLRYIER